MVKNLTDGDQCGCFGAQNTLAERCVRWLLMAHDRIDGDELAITHEALSVVLGVRRASVTIVISALHDAGLIRAGRGRVTLLNRPGLEQIAGRRGWHGAAAGPSRPMQMTPHAPDRAAG